MSSTVVGDIVKAAIEQFPSTPTLTLAKKVYKENPAVFSSLETARAAVRYYRGQIGEYNRKRSSTKPFWRDSFPHNVFDSLPEPLTDYASWEHCVLDKGKWLILADLHIPYYKRDELIIALKYGYKKHITGIVLMGDIADFYSVSDWDKDPRRRDFASERNAVLAVLGVMREIFPTQKIVYKLGNHDERLERYMKVKAPELYGLPMLNFSSIIEAPKYNIDIVADRRIIRIGRLYLVHGHEFGRTMNNPVNPARGLYLKGKEIALCAHEHQTSQHTEKSLADVITSCWSIGCLCDLHPAYRPLNKWNHGFAIVDNSKDEFVVENRKIINGNIY